MNSVKMLPGTRMDHAVGSTVIYELPSLSWGPTSKMPVVKALFPSGSQFEDRLVVSPVSDQEIVAGRSREVPSAIFAVTGGVPGVLYEFAMTPALSFRLRMVGE